MKTKEITTKSAKVSMIIFMIYFAKINFINSIKSVFVPMFKGFAIIGLWMLPLIINYDSAYSVKFNVYYIFISFAIMVLTFVTINMREDMEHAVYLNSKEYKLSFYYRLLVKLNNKLYYR